MMNRIKVLHCPICGSTNHKFAFECKDYFAGGEMFVIKNCDNCGFRFTDNFPDESDMAPYYKSDSYISHSDTNKGLMNRIYHIVRNYMLNQKGNMVEEVSRDKNIRSGVKTILDVGCGTGYFLEEMKLRGWDVTGVEKSVEAARFTRSSFDINVIPDLMLVEDSCKFNVITLWHVLEHIQNPGAALDKIYKILDKDGVLILALPNSSSYDARKYGNMWAAYDVPRHLWHFEPDTLSILINKHGFHIDRFSPMPFDAFYVSMLSEKNSGKSASFLRGCLTGAVSLFKTIGRPKESSSLIYILKKNK